MIRTYKRLFAGLSAFLMTYPAVVGLAQTPAPAPATPAGQAPAPSTPAPSAPAGQTPAPAPSTPAGQPTKGTPAGQTPAPAPSTPAGQPTKSTPAGQTPAPAPSTPAGQPTKSTPAGQTPAPAPSTPAGQPAKGGPQAPNTPAPTGQPPTVTPAGQTPTTPITPGTGVPTAPPPPGTVSPALPNTTVAPTSYVPGLPVPVGKAPITLPTTPAAVTPVALPLYGFDFFAQARLYVDSVRAQLVAKSNVGGSPAATTPDSGLTGDATLTPTPGQPIDLTNVTTPGIIGIPPTAPSINTNKFSVSPDMLSGFNVNIATPERYQLGPGDMLEVTYSTPTQLPIKVPLTLDDRGIVILPTLGKRAVLLGKTIHDAETTLAHIYKEQIKNVTVYATLKQLRTFQIHITGESYSPGMYQVPSNITLFNALYISGGPKVTGTLRNIRLKRAGVLVHTFDFYKFMNSGDNKQDIPLQPGDVIQIDPSNARASVRGEVIRAAIYEMKEGDRLKDLIGYSKGIKPTGISQRVSIQSIDPTKGFKMIDANVLSAKPENNPELYDGDTVDIYSVRPIITNLVSVEGNVYLPGRFAIDTVKGMTVADLLELARGPLQNTYYERADLYRLNTDFSVSLVRINLGKAMKRNPADNPLLKVQDLLHVYSIQDVVSLGIRTVSVSGAVNKTGDVYRADGMSIQDLILLAGGLREDAYKEKAALQRRNADGTFGPLFFVNLNRALAGDPSANLLLKDRDLLTIYTSKDLQAIPEQSVAVNGAIQRSGIYAYHPGMKVADLVTFAGGPNLDAYQEKVFVKRQNPDGTPGPLFIVNIKKALQGDPLHNIPLKEKDELSVYTVKETQAFPDQHVSALGAVQRGGVMDFHPGMKVKDLVDMSGGLTLDAYQDKAFLKRKNPDGTPGPLFVVNIRRALQGDPKHNVELLERDELNVYTLKESQALPDQYVSIAGAVQRTGQMEYHPGMRIKDLIEMAGNLNLDAFKDRAFLQRRNLDGTLGPLVVVDLTKALAGDPKQNVELKEKDEFNVYTLKDAQFLPAQTAEIQGTVQRPGVFQRGEGMRLKDLINLAGGLVPGFEEKIEIAHARKVSGTPILTVNASGVMAGNEKDNLLLEDGDVVSVRKLSNFLLAPYNITVMGSVKTPGTYPVTTKDVRLSQILKRAGNVSELGYLKGALIFRKPETLITDAQRDVAPRLRTIIQLVQADEYKRRQALADIEKLARLNDLKGATVSGANPLTGAAAQPVATPLAPELLPLSPVSPARPLRDEDLVSNGNILVDFEKAVRHPNGPDDIVLRDGDIITVPERPTTISVVGAVRQPSTILFKAGMSIEYYVSLCGGSLLDADKSDIMLVRASGRVLKASNHKLEVGDIIFVPTRVMAGKLPKTQSDLDRIFGYITNGLLSYAIIRSITK